MIKFVYYPYEGNIGHQLRDYLENRRYVEREAQKSNRKIEAQKELKKQDDLDAYTW